MFVVAANWTWTFYFTSAFSRGLVVKRTGGALRHQRLDSCGGSWPLEFSKMCVAAEVVINRKQEQPAAKKHCTYRDLFNSLPAHIMPTTVMNECVVKLLIGKVKLFCFICSLITFWTCKKKPARVDVTCTFLTFFHSLLKVLHLYVYFCIFMSKYVRKCLFPLTSDSLWIINICLFLTAVPAFLTQLYFKYSSQASSSCWLEFPVRHGFMTVSVSWLIVWSALWFSWYFCIHMQYLYSRNNSILHVLFHQKWSRKEYIVWCFLMSFLWKYPALSYPAKTFGGNSRLVWNLEECSCQNCM